MTQDKPGAAPFTIGFRWELPFGTCVGVRLPANDSVPDTVLEQLPAEERSFAQALSPFRRPGWVGGRLALRWALGSLITADTPVLPTPRGGPQLPAGTVGSISHKRTWAVALAAPSSEGWQLGVDVELEIAPKTDVSSRVLTVAERAQLVSLSAEQRLRQVLLRFSAKEAIYKALDPFVLRYVGFEEAEVEPTEHGDAVARLTLTRGEGPFEVQLGWRAWEGHLFTTARIRRVLE